MRHHLRRAVVTAESGADCRSCCAACSNTWRRLPDFALALNWNAATCCIMLDDTIHAGKLPLRTNLIVCCLKRFETNEPAVTIQPRERFETLERRRGSLRPRIVGWQGIYRKLRRRRFAVGPCPFGHGTTFDAAAMVASSYAILRQLRDKILDDASLGATR